MQFYSYLCTIEKLRKLKPEKYKKMSNREVAIDFSESIFKLYKESDKARREQLMIAKDAIFLDFGKPYYKLYPDIVEMITRTNIDIQCKFLQFPFPVFEIKLSRDVPFREAPDKPPLMAMTVARIENSEARTVYLRNEIHKDRDFSMQISYHFDTGEELPMGYLYQMGMRNEETIEECFEFADQFSTDYKDDCYVPGKEFKRNLIRIAVATCFFGVNNHEFVLPDLIRRHIVKYHGLKAQGKHAEAQEFALSKTKAKEWCIGREQVLPRPDVEYRDAKTDGEGKGYAHSHSSIRSGHLRFQAYGPRDNPTHKLVFIAPTIVRPDLPPAPAKGYQIRTP